MRVTGIAFVLVLAGCGSDVAAPPNDGGPRGAGGARGGDGGEPQTRGTGGTENAGGTPQARGSGGAGIASGGKTAGSGGKTAGSGGEAPTEPVRGGPGCGLPEAAFCDTFDAPSATKGRAGELDPREWSAGRLAPQLPSGNGCAIGIGPGTLPVCRPGLPAEVYPDQDTLVCDPVPGTSGKHLLAVVAAQNYGQNSYRIRQPFDFADRTGKIVFDAEGFTYNGLLGWISVEITEDPVNAPSFSIGAPGTNNNEGSLVPRNAVEIQFQNPCHGYTTTPSVSVSMIDVLHDHEDDIHSPETPTCVATERGKLNHFEISVSRSRVDVSATPFSPDGKTFPPGVVLFGADVALPFSRGWVHITTHNHATLKYSGPGSQGPDEHLDAWTARWDNVGFDGPVLSKWREYQIPDSNTRGQNAWNREGPVMNVGYLAADAKDTPHDVLHFPEVDVADVVAARLSLSGWYLNSSDKPLDTYVLRYRFNGKTWRERRFTEGELGQLGGTHTQGQLGQMLDVELSDLVAGDNTLEFTTVNVPQSYPPIVANIDLVLTTK